MSRPIARLSCLLALLAAGCGVDRTIRITSEPSGARVHVNDREVGRTPVTVPFTFYGVYDVRLRHDERAPLWTERRARAPWWDTPGPDLFAGLFAEKVDLSWHFELPPEKSSTEKELIERAHEMRERAAAGSGGESGRP